MKNIIYYFALVVVFTSVNARADGYKHGWKSYDNPQPGYTYGGTETNPYRAGGLKSYSPGGGNSYGKGGGKNAVNPWHVDD